MKINENIPVTSWQNKRVCMAQLNSLFINYKTILCESFTKDKEHSMVRVTTAQQWSSTRDVHQITENYLKIQICKSNNRFTDSKIPRDRLWAHVELPFNNVGFRSNDPQHRRKFM